MGELLLYKKRLSHSHKTDTKKGKRNFLSRMRICPQSIAELFEVTVGELLGAKIEEKADAVGLNEIAAQLTILKEQLANQSPHRRKFIKITAFGVFVILAFMTALYLAAFIGFWYNCSAGEITTTEVFCTFAEWFLSVKRWRRPSFLFSTIEDGTTEKSGITPKCYTAIHKLNGFFISMTPCEGRNGQALLPFTEADRWAAARAGRSCDKIRPRLTPCKE